MAEVPITEGYAAISATVIALRSYWNDEAKVRLSVGAKARKFTWGSTASWNATLAVKSAHRHRYPDVASRELRRQRRDYCVRMIANWRDGKVKTHAAIRRAYENRMREYEDELRAPRPRQPLRCTAGPFGESAYGACRIEEACHRYSDAQQFTASGSIKTGNDGHPEFKLAEAEADGRYIRFFEQGL